MLTNAALSARFDTYRQALQTHDVAHILSFYAEDFELLFVTYGASMTKAQLQNALGWDVGANGRYTFEDLSYADSIVRGLLTERNDFFALLGLPSLQARVAYHYNEEGLIAHQEYEQLPDQPPWHPTLQTAIAWARQHRPDELAVVYPDDTMVYTEEMARRWVSLLQAWQEAR